MKQTSQSLSEVVSRKAAAADSPVFVSDKQLAKRYGVHRTTIWRWVRNGEFPPPFKISEGCTRWSMGAVLDHEQNCAA